VGGDVRLEGGGLIELNDRRTRGLVGREAPQEGRVMMEKIVRAPYPEEEPVEPVPGIETEEEEVEESPLDDDVDEDQ
jgi:hypothetical protein